MKHAVSPRHTSGTYGPMAQERIEGDTESTAGVASESTGRVDTTGETVARGRASETPFALLGGVALVIWAFVALVAAALLLLWWLG
jgi:5,10-methenyltetrahydromethanopterin hydrogenase